MFISSLSGEALPHVFKTHVSPMEIPMTPTLNWDPLTNQCPGQQKLRLNTQDYRDKLMGMNNFNFENTIMERENESGYLFPQVKVCHL